ncbi:hypothetical protein H7849_16930 [Alloacidobacterium dinghuense]|uniref:Uncharacterized protein n=1 Tax=Alloacidobacterium dinghuense TaxID=2763107 RepID=A0A7G8BE23_9BACT|nr:hypothetical protein [Alloacidobacterium dinghuense]QNI30793.1 hypothetical protein H7849_16930 [Alloacidobacterium dinghuense]
MRKQLSTNSVMNELTVEKRSRSLLKFVLLIVLAGCPLLLVEFVLYVGLTFTAPTNIGIWLRVFLLFGCLLDLPALVLAIVWQRGAGYWLAGNAIISWLIYLAFQAQTLFSGNSTYHPPLSSLLKTELAFQWKAVLFWGLKLICASCLLIISRSSVDAPSERIKSFTRIARPIAWMLVGGYSVCAVLLLFSWYL